MASLDYTKPILQSDDRKIKQTLLHDPTAGQQSLFLVPNHRPRPDLPLEQREIIESNFVHQTTTRPSHSWSWEKTEKYVHYKDTLMLDYLYDYPMVDWVIDAEAARYAVENLLAREGMSKLNLSVYTENTPFSWWIRGEAAPTDDDLLPANDEDEQEEVEGIEGMEAEQGFATPEPLVASPNLSHMADPATSEAPRDPEDEHMSDPPQDNATEKPTVQPKSRRLTCVVEQKLKEEWDQQVKEESMDPYPRTLPTKTTVAAFEGSKGRKTVEVKQQDDLRPCRRSTRVSAKRSFADEPWSTPKRSN
ncbi:hypothetical protein QM012_002081 [Aureobasidium pullulans]|uniref:Uncharacterized protein n=1 Tax=Aureobasidium pullulans TaxID=5580 RepID=A0ABR0TDC3_AURPU